MNNYTKSQFCRAVAYDYMFDDLKNPGHSTSFPCDEQGKILDTVERPMTPTHWEHFYECQNSVDYSAGYVKKREWSYVESASGNCMCGFFLILHSAYENECPKCHERYDGFGTHLAHKSQWYDYGEEGDGDLFTGEEYLAMGEYK